MSHPTRATGLRGENVSHHPDRTQVIPIQEGQRPRRGRPRDGDLTARLLDGALDVLAERGFDRLNADLLATRTGSGKAAVYRRWPGIVELAADALTAQVLIEPAPDTGSLRGDLLAMLGPWSRPLNRDERAVAAVLGAARHNSLLQRALEQTVVAPLRDALGTVVRNQCRRGTVVPDGRVRLAGVLVQALWWDRCLCRTQPLTPSQVEHIVDSAILPVLTQH